MTGLPILLYDASQQSIILMLVLSVYLSVPARYRERNVVSPSFSRRRKELHLASCTNCFSSLYDARFESKSIWNFSTGYGLESVHVRYTFRLPLPLAGWILPFAWTPLELSRRSRVPQLILETFSFQFWRFPQTGNGGVPPRVRFLRDRVLVG